MNVTQSHEQGVLVTKREAANILKVSPRTVDRYISDGRLTSVQLSKRATRIHSASVSALIAERAE